MFEVVLIAALWMAPGPGEGELHRLLSAWTENRVAEDDSARPVALEILAAAKRMVEIAPRYRFDFPQIGYPAGDPAAGYGHCCDVVVRACRAAGVDLQQLIYEDSLRERHRYIEANRMHSFSRPLNRSWIHRRTANLNLFLQRHALSLPTRFDPDRLEEWQPGDIVIYRKGGRLTWHAAIVSDVVDPVRKVPRVIDAWTDPGHVSENHLLTDHGEIAGHYRIEAAFRDSLPEEHRTTALLAWQEFLEESGFAADRVADSAALPKH